KNLNKSFENKNCENSSFDSRTDILFSEGQKETKNVRLRYMLSVSRRNDLYNKDYNGISE
ncbi:hypothetical protein PMALA_072840, partial [Plasmodium malariae]